MSGSLATIRRYRFGARWVVRLSHFPAFLALLRFTRSQRMTRFLFRKLVGHYRPFASVSDALDAIAAFPQTEHESVENSQAQLAQTIHARPSDYAALFHLSRILPEIRSVFDVGGNVGNLFYSYSQYIDVPTSLQWQVYDLPKVTTRGDELRSKRGIRQLSFTTAWSDASGADLLFLSGSLHYLRSPLPKMIEELPIRPHYILINRTPFTDGSAIATIQAGPTSDVACMIHNREDLISALQELEYDLVDSWSVPELSLLIPAFPECSASSYSGLFFHKRISDATTTPIYASST